MYLPTLITAFVSEKIGGVQIKKITINVSFFEAGDDIVNRGQKDNINHLMLTRLKTKIKGLHYDRYKR